MQPAIDKLLRFIRQQPLCQHYQELAHESFFREFSEAHGLATLNDITEALGETAMQMVFPCMLEFFFSNDYLEDGHRWNVIDLFLKKRGALLNAKDKTYLRAIRQSHMSLYEIVEIETEKGMLLRDLIDDVPPVFVFEKSMTRQVSAWDTIGVRVCNEDGRLTLAGGALVLSRDVGIVAAKNIRALHDGGRDYLRSLSSANDADLAFYTPEENERLMKVLWAKEIGLAYLEDCWNRLHRKIKLHNKDGHELRFHTMTFPLNVDWKEITKRLDSVEDYHRDDDSRHRKFWNWVRPMDVMVNTPIDEEADDDNVHVQTIETTLSADDSDEILHVMGTIELLKDKMIAQANSLERAKLHESRLATLLGDRIGTAVWEVEDMPAVGAFEGEPAPARRVKQRSRKAAIADEHQTDMIRNMILQHYQETLSSPIPGLGNKSPKQLSATEEGRKKLVDWLKGVENSVRHLERQSGIHEVMDMTWMWDELGIKRDNAAA